MMYMYLVLASSSVDVPWVWFNVAIGEVSEQVRVERVDIVTGEGIVRLLPTTHLQSPW